MNNQNNQYYRDPNQGNKSSILDLDENIAAMLSAVLPIAMTMISHMSFGAWVIPLVVFLLEKHSWFVRLCAAQSFAAALVITVAAIVTKSIDLVIDGVGFFALVPMGVIGLLMSLAQVICLIVLVMIAIKAYRMQIFEIPTVTNWIRKNIENNNM